MVTPVKFSNSKRLSGKPEPDRLGRSDAAFWTTVCVYSLNSGLSGRRRGSVGVPYSGERLGKPLI